LSHIDKEQKHIFSFHFSKGGKTKTIDFYKKQVIAVFLAITVIVGGGCYMTGTYINTKKNLNASVSELQQTEKNHEALQKKAALLEVENKKYTEHIAEIESKAVAIEEKVAELEKTKEDLYQKLDKVNKVSNQETPETKKNETALVMKSIETITNTVANQVETTSSDEVTTTSADVATPETCFIEEIKTAYHKIDAITITLDTLEKEVDLEHLDFMDVSETVTETVAILTAPSGVPTQVRKFTTEFDPNGLNGRVHKGLDVCAYLDSPVVATASGTVVDASFHSGYGNYVKIDHGNGYITLYAHNNSLTVQTGDVVEKGDTIALAGSTGNSTGVHVHYEIIYEGMYQNPRDFI